MIMNKVLFASIAMATALFAQPADSAKVAQAAAPTDTAKVAEAQAAAPADTANAAPALDMSMASPKSTSAPKKAQKKPLFHGNYSRYSYIQKAVNSSF